VKKPGNGGRIILGLIFHNLLKESLIVFEPLRKEFKELVLSVATLNYVLMVKFIAVQNVVMNIGDRLW